MGISNELEEIVQSLMALFILDNSASLARSQGGLSGVHCTMLPQIVSSMKHAAVKIQLIPYLSRRRMSRRNFALLFALIFSL